MARKKQYSEDEVVEKAMYLFWKNGYETTSMQMLEKEMGINKFSIYSSFGNKHNLFLESIKCYKNKTKSLFDNFKNATNGVADIKQFFFDSIAISQNENCQNGCLLTNTYNEFADSDDRLIINQLSAFMDNLKLLFQEKLRINSDKDEETIVKQANYLLLAKHGLAAASRVNNQKEIEDYIEMTFQNI
jgi:AcrR family transcriptional regulator